MGAEVKKHELQDISPGQVYSKSCNFYSGNYATSVSLVLAGAAELAGVGVALSVYQTVTKLLNVPLLSIATTSVASAQGVRRTRRLNLILQSATLKLNVCCSV